LCYSQSRFFKSTVINNNKSEEGSKPRLKRPATYDEDFDMEDDEGDVETEPESTATEWSGNTSTDYFAPGPAANLPLRRVLNMRPALPTILSSGLVDWELLFDM